jgi:hypothetical protein
VEEKVEGLQELNLSIYLSIFLIHQNRMDFSLFISFEATARGKPIVRDLGDVFDKNGDHGGFKQPKSGKHVV